MSQTESPHDADFQEQSARLNEGLKNCRAVVEGYRSMMGGAGVEAQADGHPDALNDNTD